jgi:putative hemolysin
LNALFTAAQTAAAAIGPESRRRLEQGETFLAKASRPYLARLTSLESRFSMGALFMLFSTAFLLAAAGYTALPLMPSVGSVLGIGLALTVQLVLIETLVRALVLANPKRGFVLCVPIASVLAVPLLPLMLPAYLIGSRRREVAAGLGEMHLKLLPSLSGVDRVIEEEAVEMIDSVRDFAASTAEDIMRPRTQVEGIPENLSADEIRNRLQLSPYSRLVVYRGSLDNVVGTLLSKEVLLLNSPNPLSRLREPIFVSEKMRLPDLLQTIRSRRSHMVIVQDEYGGMSGIVTLHDLFERIIGDIPDEDDDAEIWMVRGADGSFKLDGRLEISELNDELHLGLDEDEARTLGGLILNRLGRMARPGDEIRVGNERLRVLSCVDNRVGSVELIPAAAPAPEPEATT